MIFDLSKGLKVSQRITLGFAIQVVFILVLGLAALFSFRLLSDQLTETSQQQVPELLSVSQLDHQLQQMLIIVLQHSRQTSSEALAPYQQTLTENQQQLKNTLMMTNGSGTDGIYAQLQKNSGNFLQLSQAQLAKNKEVLNRRLFFQQALSEEQESVYELKDALDTLHTYADEQQDQWTAASMLEQVQFLLSSITWVDRSMDSAEVQQERQRKRDIFQQLQQQSSRLSAEGREEVEPFLQSMQAAETTSLIHLKLRLLQGIAEKEQGLDQLQKLGQLVLQQVDTIQTDALNRVQEAQRESEQLVQHRYWLISALLLASIVIALVTGLLIIRSIHRPLQKITEFLAQLQSGNLTHRTPVLQKDEFGQLAEHCNTLGKCWQQMVTELSQLAGNIAQSARENKALSHETEQGSQVQQQSLQVSASALEQMSQAIAMVASRTEKGQTLINQSSTQATSCYQLMLANSQQVQTLSEQLKSAEQVVQQQQKNSEKIDQVVEVIESLANQTSLLALNAAIEAARSGPAGRGFAVVADEVRALAESTHKSTDQIQSTVHLLQQDSRKTRDLIQQSSTEAIACTQQTQQAQGELQQLTAILQELQQLSSEIASATEQQSVTCQHLSCEINQVAEHSVLMTEKTGQMSTLNDQLAQSAQQQAQNTEQFQV